MAFMNKDFNCESPQLIIGNESGRIHALSREKTHRRLKKNVSRLWRRNIGSKIQFM